MTQSSNHVAKIPITRRGGEIVAWAMVDKEDAALVQRFKWHLHPKGYVVAGVNDYDLTGRYGQVTTSMHRLIMGCKESTFA
jgi:hypothetical protein